MPPNRRRLRHRQRLALGDQQLQPHQVQPRDALGDRVLHLQPGVHLQEEELAVGREEELDRAGVHVADRAGGGGRGCVQLCAQLVGHGRRRCLLDQLLVPALDRALPLAQREHRAVRVGDELYLDVPRAVEVRLAEDGAVTEGRRRLAPGLRHRVGEPGPIADYPHAAPAATGGRLDQHREPLDGFRVHSGQYRYPGLGHGLLGRHLGTHRRDGLRRWTDPGEPGVGHRRRELRVLRQEAVPRMHRVGTGPQRGRDHEVAAQVSVGRRGARQPHRPVRLPHVQRVSIGIGIHRNGFDAERAAGGEDPAGDLAPVGDQQPADHGRLTRVIAPHIRKTPKPPAPSTGPLWTADSAIPSTVRVSRGSITPSS